MTGRALLLVGLGFLVALMWGLAIASRHLEEVASGIMPLENRRFESLSVVTAGSGGTHENHLRLGPCIAVGRGETLLLVDAGRGVTQALRAAEIPVAQARTVLLTSLLPENTLGLDDWLVTASLDPGRTPLRVIGPPGTATLVSGLENAHRAGADPQLDVLGLPPLPSVATQEITERYEGTLDDLQLRAVLLDGGPVPALAWRIEAEPHAVVVSGAGWDLDAVAELAAGADIWVQEAVSGEALDQAIEAGVPNADAVAREGALHARLEEIGALGAHARVRTLVLTRLRPPPVLEVLYERNAAAGFRGRVVIASDGDLVTP
jgi:ribonuclease BN (tRNA processing enzyme)